MSEVYQAGETAPPASDAGATAPYDAGSGPASADNAGSYPDAAPGDDFAGYSDADIDAILAAEDQLPEPRTRQEAAAATWDDNPDDPAGDELAAEYEGDLAALLAAEEQLPEPRTRQEAAAATWDDESATETSQLRDTDHAATSPDLAGQPANPLNGQEAAGDDRSTQDRRAPASERNEDGSPLTGARTEQQGPGEAGPGSAALSQNVSETATGTGDGKASETRQGQDQHEYPSPDEPSAEERARLHQLYQDYLKEQRSGREQGTNAVGDKPSRSPGDTSDLPPTGEELLEMDSDKLSRLGKFREEAYREIDDIFDVSEQDGGTIMQLFDRPPTGSHTEIPAGHPVIEQPPASGVDGGHFVVAGLALAIAGLEAGRAVKHTVQKWKRR